MEYDHTQQMMKVAESRVSLNKTKEEHLRNSMAHQAFENEENKLLLERRKIELQDFKINKLDEIMREHKSWSADKIKRLYPDLAEYVDDMFDENSD